MGREVIASSHHQFASHARCVAVLATWRVKRLHAAEPSCIQAEYCQHGISVGVHVSETATRHETSCITIRCTTVCSYIEWRSLADHTRHPRRLFGFPESEKNYGVVEVKARGITCISVNPQYGF